MSDDQMRLTDQKEQRSSAIPLGMLAVAVLIGLGLILTLSKIKESSRKLSGPPAKYEGEWVFLGFGNGFDIQGNSGYTTVSDFQNISQGDLVLKITKNAAKTFEGEFFIDLIPRKYEWKTITGRLTEDGSLELTVFRDPSKRSSPSRSWLAVRPTALKTKKRKTYQKIQLEAANDNPDRSKLETSNVAQGTKSAQQNPPKTEFKLADFAGTFWKGASRSGSSQRLMTLNFLSKSSFLEIGEILEGYLYFPKSNHPPSRFVAALSPFSRKKVEIWEMKNIDDENIVPLFHFSFLRKGNVLHDKEDPFNSTSLILTEKPDDFREVPKPERISFFDGRWYSPWDEFSIRILDRLAIGTYDKADREPIGIPVFWISSHQESTFRVDLLNNFAILESERGIDGKVLEDDILELRDGVKYSTLCYEEWWQNAKSFEGNFIGTAWKATFRDRNDSIDAKLEFRREAVGKLAGIVTIFVGTVSFQAPFVSVATDEDATLILDFGRNLSDQDAVRSRYYKLRFDHNKGVGFGKRGGILLLKSSTNSPDERQ